MHQLVDYNTYEGVTPDKQIKVQTPDGVKFWTGVDLEKRIEFARQGLDVDIPIDKGLKWLTRSLVNGVPEADLKVTILLNAKSLLERDSEFSYFAARILLTYIYEEALGWDIVRDGAEKLSYFHQTKFLNFITEGLELGLLDHRLYSSDTSLGYNLDIRRDLQFDLLGIQTLYDRYLLQDKTTDKFRVIETPQFFWMRVAAGLSLNESSDQQLSKTIEFYDVMSQRLYCPSTPTLFNAGTPRPQLSSCYLYKVDDSIESIFQRGIAENAYLSKWAGGLGGSWTSVRSTNSKIKGTNGTSQGVIPFLKVHNDMLGAVNQGGKRRGSGCAYLEVWHADIFDFLDLRKNTGDDRRRTHDMNTAVWIPDLFMERMEAREDWTLVSPSEAPELHSLYGNDFREEYINMEKRGADGEITTQTIPAIDLWKAILKALFETGHPWITFKDTCNRRNMQNHCGVIHSSNLCTEITLNTSEEETAVCNLGSIVLDTHIDSEGGLMDDLLRNTIQTAVRMLDNVIDLNWYPTKAAEISSKRHRPIGLGLMGLQNYFFKNMIPFDSNQAIEEGRIIMEKIAFLAYRASSNLSGERGMYASYKHSKWSKSSLPPCTLEDEAPLNHAVWKYFDRCYTSTSYWEELFDHISNKGIRNSTVLAIAPTATISNIIGSSPCIEPQYKNLYVKSNLSGDFIVLNKYLVDELKNQNIWDDQMIKDLKQYNGELHNISRIPDYIKDVFRTAFDLNQEKLIEAAAYRQVWIDQSQSLNLFLKDPCLKTLSHLYRKAWHWGLKTTYYLRTTSASDIEKSTIDRNYGASAIIGGDLCKINDPECESCQ